MSQAMTTVLLPPPPPEHFSGVVPAAPANSPTLPDLINAILYYQQLGLSCYQGNVEVQAKAMIYQARIVNALIRQDYPNDVSNIQSPGTEAGLAEKIASMVSKDVKAELNRSLTEAKDDMNTRFTLLNKRIDERFQDIDKRIEQLSAAQETQSNKTSQFMREANEKLDSVDKRIEKLSADTSAIVNRLETQETQSNKASQFMREANEKLDSVDKRIEKLSADTSAIVNRLETQETQSNKASQFMREANEKLDSVSSQINKFEETTRELDSSVNNLRDNRDIVAIVKQVVATEIRDVKEKVFQIDGRLDTMDEKLNTMQVASADTQQRLKQSQRTQRLQLNHLALRGPWISIPNEEGVDPTQMPHDLPLLQEHRSLNNLSREQIRQYILFYGIAPGRTRSEKSQFANTENWSTDYLEAMKKSLMLYITTPV